MHYPLNKKLGGLRLLFGRGSKIKNSSAPVRNQTSVVLLVVSHFTDSYYNFHALGVRNLETG
jgi:hypothetical protein